MSRQNSFVGMARTTVDQEPVFLDVRRYFTKRETALRLGRKHRSASEDFHAAARRRLEGLGEGGYSETPSPVSRLSFAKCQSPAQTPTHTPPPEGLFPSGASPEDERALIPLPSLPLQCTSTHPSGPPQYILATARVQGRAFWHLHASTPDI
eukprot:g81496.t1